MGKKAPKSVKKFTKKHLKSVIAKRRKLKPMRNALRHKEAALEDKRRKAALAENAADASTKKKKKMEEMNVDELMDGDFLDDGDDDVENGVGSDDASDPDAPLPEVDGEEEDFIDITPPDVEDDSESDDGDNAEVKNENKKFKSEIEKHKMDLEKLKGKDPEFYKFLEEHDQELLGFKEDEEEEQDDAEKPTSRDKEEDSLTIAHVETWIIAVKEKENYAALRKLLGAFRSACHYGEGAEEELSERFVINSSNVFNKVMVFILSELDGIFKKMLHIHQEKKVATEDLKKIGRWKKLFPFVKSYLASALHVLNQMTDNRMISFTLRRLRPSIVVLGEFPALGRKFLKAAFHFWSTGEQSLSFVAFSCIRDMAMQLGTDCLESCSKTIYKQFVSSAKFVSATTLPRIQFLANCVVELYGVDIAVSYQCAFTFIKQLAIILRNALTVKSKDSFKKVYCWQYMASLELWVKVVSAYTGKDNLQPLAYPLAQILGGVSRLVPTARYFPLRMQCAVMLNRLAAATNTFIPVAPVLLDMLDFKEMKKPPTGGAGDSVDFHVVIKVGKPVVKTRAFQEECVNTVLEQLAEHLTQWCYSVAFPELALIPLAQLRRFVKETNVDRFRRLARQLVEQIERNVEFVTKKREGVSFSPKDSEAVASFLKAEREAGTSPLFQYCNVLRERAKERRQALVETSVEVKQKPDEDELARDDGKAKELFNKKWHQQKKRAGTEILTKKQQKEEEKEKGDQAGVEEDRVEDLLLSDDDEQDDEGVRSNDDEATQKPANKKRKRSSKQKQRTK
ncbi:nucleolar complex protein 2 homolog [Selaginella moellendorffii]|uniref:nucleolar complex protein 2 homolog n=1 Tax=Selaginella moellendorffii TaxID=88036 RepID=UPI000D1CB3A3|nr:nucleolar complex protein 2 homolog [Selaginella moellendorffii]|eukprot:XP_024538947.1 nucleolar complex protein 2 homolog [Selaginella moellendorffii]